MGMKYPSHLILDLQTIYLQDSCIKTNLNFKNSIHSSKIQSRTTYFFLSFPKLTNAKKNKINQPVRSFSVYFPVVYDINFLRKEKIYTKLKYSRCPQYDIISGGFAAIFAGFIGF